jgi:hypothetical protein
MSYLRNMRKQIVKMFVFGGLVALFTTCASANTIWDLDATFRYNFLSNMATGNFQLNPSLAIVNWDITVTGTNTAANDVYNPGDSIPVFPDLTHLDFYDFNTNRYINLKLQSPFTNAGGSINLLFGNGNGADDDATTVCSGCGTLVSGKVVGTAATPEPASIALVGGAGLLGLALVRRKRRVAR